MQKQAHIHVELNTHSQTPIVSESKQGKEHTQKKINPIYPASHQCTIPILARRITDKHSVIKGCNLLKKYIPFRPNIIMTYDKK